VQRAKMQSSKSSAGASQGAALTAAALAFDKQRHNGASPGTADWRIRHGAGSRAEAARTPPSRGGSPHLAENGNSSSQSPLPGRLADGSPPRPGHAALAHGRLGAGRSDDAATPSLLAATLAASRSASPSPVRRPGAVADMRSAEARWRAASNRGRSCDAGTRDLALVRASRRDNSASGSPANPVASNHQMAPGGRGVSTVRRHSSGESISSDDDLAPARTSTKGLRRRPLSSRPASPPLRPTLTAPPATDLALSSLASAMMAGSLASARHRVALLGTGAASPGYPSARHSHETSQGSSPRRMAIPQTLRRHAASDDESLRRQRHGHSRPVVSTRHTHQEGARRKWKEEVSLRERRRYEAVWASNRGLFATGEDDSREHVASVVVRDLWSRSRLPADELAEVWDLVDVNRSGRLGKAEFVVGMWLLDQRLAGRKIPARVAAGIWSSAKGFGADRNA